MVELKLEKYINIVFYFLLGAVIFILMFVLFF